MTLSRFQELIEDEFGSAFAAVVLNDTRITALGDQTPKALLASGCAPKEVWLAICQQLEIPEERWQGKIKTKRHAD